MYLYADLVIINIQKTVACGYLLITLFIGCINDKIIRQIPVIVQKSAQEQPQKPKRKGFLGIFGKKEEAKPTVTTTMLRFLNKNMVAEQQAQSRRLSEHANSLPARNAELNRQLQSLIRQIDGKIQAYLQKRE